MSDHGTQPVGWKTTAKVTFSGVEALYVGSLQDRITELEAEVERLKGGPLEWFDDIEEIESKLLSWTYGDTEVHLHGGYTAQEYRAIATWMEEQQ